MNHIQFPGKAAFPNAALQRSPAETPIYSGFISRLTLKGQLRETRAEPNLSQRYAAILFGVRLVLSAAEGRLAAPFASRMILRGAAFATDAIPSTTLPRHATSPPPAPRFFLECGFFGSAASRRRFAADVTPSSTLPRSTEPHPASKFFVPVFYFSPIRIFFLQFSRPVVQYL